MATIDFDLLFNHLESQLMDNSEVSIDLTKIDFITVQFLEKLESLLQKAKELKVQTKIINVKPEIYKVFQVNRNKDILAVCC